MKKILISHRGNISGKVEELENHPDYILTALAEGYDVEIDVWWENESYYLGHDKPQYKIKSEFLKNEKLWCHAKNYKALISMLQQGIHCFWHESDKVTLTSHGFIWANPNQQPLDNSIAVMPEVNDEETSQCIGICSDVIQEYKE
tara:strand:- start:234 stop:668 length:435 start_codon:yes stop_codon:yes gene_type:complete